MAIDATSPSSRMRRRTLWSALGVVLLLCAWFGSRDDDSVSETVRPLTHATAGSASPTRSGNVSTEQLRAHQLTVSLRQALAASSPRAEFPPLTDVGRAAWAGTALPAAAAPSSESNPVAVTPAPPAFPYQWVGMWTQPGKARDGADTISMAIIAGPYSTWTVKQGDVLDEDWKIVAISADQIQVTHLPTSSRQTIKISKQ